MSYRLKKLISDNSTNKEPPKLFINEYCEWEYIGTDINIKSVNKYYESKCGQEYVMAHEYNEFIYCPYCGKKIKEVENE